jgi:nucleotide-binding universal stress UspA family protein
MKADRANSQPLSALNMKPERILLPIDVARCPLEVFALVNGIAQHPEVTVTLLHVLDLHILAPDNRVYEELSHAAARYLERLARACLPALPNVLIRVRTGRPAEAILAEARAQDARLIILPAGRRSFWKQLFAPIVGRTSTKVIRKAPCTVLVANVKARFNCQEAWGRQSGEISAAPGARRAAGASSPEPTSPDHRHRLLA